MNELRLRWLTISLSLARIVAFSRSLPFVEFMTALTFIAIGVENKH